VIAVDTNILVYSHRRDSPFHDPAVAAVRQLAEGQDRWALPWPCIHEFIANVTHPRIYRTPSPLALALDQVQEWFASPSILLLAEEEGYWPTLRQLLAAAQVSGGRVHDARVAALCIHHGVSELWTADRDFGRFPAIRTRNPVAGEPARKSPAGGQRRKVRGSKR